MSDEALSWGGMWSATPPTPKGADVIRWHDDSAHWVRMPAQSEPRNYHRGTKKEKLERGAQTRETIMAMLRRHPAGLTTADIADALGQPGHTSMVAPHLKHLRADGRVIPGPRGRCAVNGGRRWMAIENPPA